MDNIFDGTTTNTSKPNTSSFLDPTTSKSNDIDDYQNYHPKLLEA